MTLKSENSENLTYEKGKFVVHEYGSAASKSISAMKDSGFLDQLVSRGILIPFTMVESAHAGLVVTQPKGSIFHSFELPFEAVRQIGLKSLELWSLLDKNGYGLTDCHLGNWVLHEGEFKFVDFGSFIVKTKKNNLYFAELEFRQTFLVPLKFYRRRKFFMARVLLGTTQVSFLGASDQILLYSGWKLKTLLKFVPASRYKLLANAFYSMGSEIDENFVVSRFEGSSFLRTAARVYFKWVKPIVHSLTRIRINRYERFLRNLNLTFSTGEIWSDYGENFEGADGRSKRILQLIETINPVAVTDVGGNSGHFARLILSKLPDIKRYLVLDADNVALNIGMNLANRQDLQFAYFNFSAPTIDANLPGFETRFSSELVLALAVTHHILLTDGLSMGLVTRRLSSLTTREVLVEFMPKGLWVEGMTPNTPNWYTLDNFLDALKEHFEILSVEELGPNRVLIHGRKLSTQITRSNDKIS